MKLPMEAELLRIYISEGERHHQRPLYEAIVEEARRRGLAGATVFRGIFGFGAQSVARGLAMRLDKDPPMVIEVVDKPDRIAEFLPALDNLITLGLVTLEKIRFIAYRPDEPAAQTPSSLPNAG